MCTRYLQYRPLSAVQAAFDFDLDLDDPVVQQLAGRYNISPTETVLAIVDRDGERHAATMRWGLIPFWTVSLTGGKSGKTPIDAKGKRVQTPFNARSETVETLRSFKPAFEKRRCLIPADGFYEGFEGPQGAKAPMHVSLKSDQPFAMAGLWNYWKPAESGDPILSCTIVTTTTEANRLMEPIHDRMPVILPADAQAIWLDHSVDATPTLKELLVPYAGSAMRAYRVRPPRGDGPELITPAAT